MTEDVSKFVERMGLFFEEEGQPRIAGRLFGFLYASGEPKSLDEIAKSLSVSKASVSINARHLAQIGMLERVPRSDSRRDYYKVGDDLFARALSQRVARLRAFGDLLKEFENQNPSTPVEVTARSREYASGQAYVLEAIESALATWRTRPKVGAALNGFLHTEHSAAAASSNVGTGAAVAIAALDGRGPHDFY